MNLPQRAPGHLPDCPKLLVALDVDGTITRSDSSISQATKDAVAQLRKCGAAVTIATGRSVESTRPILDELGMDDMFLVCANGAMLVHAGDCENPPEVLNQVNNGSGDKSVMKRDSFFPEQLSESTATTTSEPSSATPDANDLELVTFTTRADEGERLPRQQLCYRILRRHTFNPATAIEALHRAMPDGIIGSETVEHGFLVSAPFPPGELLEASAVVGVEELKRHRATRIVLRAPDMDVKEFEKVVSRAGLHSVQYAVGWTAWLDVAPAGVTKATGLEELRQLLGVPRHGCVAAGDGLNDLEMIQWASNRPNGKWAKPGGWAIALGNASEQLKRLADAVTEHTDRDGLAQALQVLRRR